jgi:hypothetical protein
MMECNGPYERNTVPPMVLDNYIQNVKGPGLSRLTDRRIPDSSRFETALRDDTEYLVLVQGNAHSETWEHAEIAGMLAYHICHNVMHIESITTRNGTHEMGMGLIRLLKHVARDDDVNGIIVESPLTAIGFFLRCGFVHLRDHDDIATAPVTRSSRSSVYRPGLGRMSWWEH